MKSKLGSLYLGQESNSKILLSVKIKKLFILKILNVKNVEVEIFQNSLFFFLWCSLTSVGNLSNSPKLCRFFFVFLKKFFTIYSNVNWKLLEIIRSRKSHVHLELK